MELIKIKKLLCEKSVKWVVLLYGLAISIAANLPALLNLKHGSMDDWAYMNALSLFVRSCILHFKTIFLYDPWCFGGFDELANLQNRLFSPLGILDLLFTPQLANIISLIIYGTIGFIGCYYLLKHYKISFLINIGCSTIFINAQWFGLHYSSGHIPLGSFLLLPWVLFSIVNIYERKQMFFFTSLCALFVLDGGMYVFTCSIILLMSSFLFRLIDYKKIFNKAFFTSNWWYIILLCLFFILITSVKTIPGLFGYLSSPHVPVQIPIESFLFIFLNASAWSRVMFNTTLGFHEFGCYLGLVAIVLIIIYLLKKKNLAKSSKFILAGLFFLWTASGLGGSFNPWSIVELIPLLNTVRIQSRFLIVMYLFWIIILSFALQRLKINKFKWACMLIFFLVIESFFVRMYPMHKMFSLAEQEKRPAFTQSIILNNNLDKTISEGNKPFNYSDNFNQGVKHTYEMYSLNTNIRSEEDEGYRGEIYFYDRGVNGTVFYKEVIPGRVTFEYQINSETILPVVIEMNLNYLAGWKVLSNNAAIYIPDKNDRIRVEVNQFSDTVVIQYNPWYFTISLTAYLAGLLSGVLLLIITFRKKRKIQKRE